MTYHIAYFPFHAIHCTTYVAVRERWTATCSKIIQMLNLDVDIEHMDLLVLTAIEDLATPSVLAHFGIDRAFFDECLMYS